MEAVKRNYSLRRLLNRLILLIQKFPIFPGQYRWKLLSMTGMKVSKCYIGANVSFDTLRPDLIEIQCDVTLTSGTVILTHFYVPERHGYVYGPVIIGSGTFIGMNTMIVKSVTIGSNSVIGAGSIVTKNIDDNEIWAGNPAKFIKKV